MKSLIYITVSVLLGAMWISCDKNEGAHYPVPSSFSVSPATMQSLPKDGTSLELSITAGNLGWWIESTQTWCKISRQYGSGDGKVTLTVDENSSGAARQAEITVSPTFKQKPVTIVINQQ